MKTKRENVKVLPMAPKNTTDTTARYLEPCEVWGLEKSRLLSDLRTTELEVVALRKQSLADKRIIFDLSARQTETAVAKEETAILQKQADEKKVRLELLDAIKKRLGIKSETFGYNPDTLEVIE